MARGDVGGHAEKILVARRRTLAGQPHERLVFLERDGEEPAGSPRVRVGVQLLGPGLLDEAEIALRSIITRRISALLSAKTSCAVRRDGSKAMR